MFLPHAHSAVLGTLFAAALLPYCSVRWASMLHNASFISGTGRTLLSLSRFMVSSSSNAGVSLQMHINGRAYRLLMLWIYCCAAGGYGINSTSACACLQRRAVCGCDGYLVQDGAGCLRWDLHIPLEGGRWDVRAAYGAFSAALWSSSAACLS